MGVINPPPAYGLVSFHAPLYHPADGSIFSPADSTTYYLPHVAGINSLAAGSDFTRMYISMPCRVVACEFISGVAGSLGSSETATASVRKNNTTNETISSGVQHNAIRQSYSNRSMSTSLVPGDFIDIVVATPTWATNPTGVQWTVDVTLEF